MELRQLRYFLTIINEGSFNRAAAVLNLTQSSLSHSMKALERSVGGELLLRSGAGVQPTEIGEQFARYAQNITRESEKALAYVLAMRGSGIGRLAIGVQSVLATHFFPPVLARFLALQHGSCDVTVFTSRDNQLIDSVLRAELDLVLTLVTDNASFPPDIGVRLLSSTRSSIYCSSAHSLASAPVIGLADLARFEWLLTPLDTSEILLRQMFAEIEHAPIVRLRSGSVPLILALVDCEPYLCLMPDDAVQPEVKAGRLTKISGPWLDWTSDIAVLHSNLSERTPEMRSIIQLLAAQATALKAHT